MRTHSIHTQRLRSWAGPRISRDGTRSAHDPRATAVVDNVRLWHHICSGFASTRHPAERPFVSTIRHGSELVTEDRRRKAKISSKDETKDVPSRVAPATVSSATRELLSK